MSVLVYYFPHFPANLNSEPAAHGCVFQVIGIPVVVCPTFRKVCRREKQGISTRNGYPGYPGTVPFHPMRGRGRDTANIGAPGQFLRRLVTISFGGIPATTWLKIEMRVL
eukprot:32395-Rhodomonas_salina.2